MRLRFYRALYVCAGLFIVVSILYGCLRIAAAESGSTWITTVTPALNKVVDLPDNTAVDGTNADCSKELYVPDNLAPPQVICTFASPLGELTTGGRMRAGDNKLVNLYGPTAQSVFMHTVNPSIALVSLRAPTTGNNVGIYRHLTKAALQKTIGDAGPYYTVTVAPDEVIKNPVTRQPLQIDTYDVAFSRNGEWLLANMPHDGLLRVHMTDLSVQLFAAPLEPQWYFGLANPPLAISNDGRYAAANRDIFAHANLTVYDLSTCSDQLNVPSYNRTYCAGKNIWQGQTLSGQPMGGSILAQRPDLSMPVHLRFIDNDTIGFSAVYDQGPNHTFKAANFVVTAPGAVQHRLGLLGMGDSFISGQGAFDYREGTDTQNNTCHLSELSYPFILGKEAFNSYNSVACSGAVTGDVMGESQEYQGQVNDDIPQKKRAKNPILSNFQPGYIYQQEFASTYKPETIVLSVGGNDIGFAEILKQCVANSGGGTCYDTYEDRVEVLNVINRTYSKLVQTYTTLREQSAGARIYVVGYPQVAKPGGDCGLNVHLNAEEVVFAAQLIDYLNSVVEKAAQTAGVFYVDTAHAFDDHRLCEAAAGQSAMNGFTVGGDTGITIREHIINFIGNESYHPTKLGHQLLAQTISQKTAKLRADMPRPTPYTVPRLDPAAAIIQGVKHEGRPTNIVYRGTSMTQGVAVAGDTLRIDVTGLEAALQPNTPYQVVLHSTPVTIGMGSTDQAGNISTAVNIPSDALAGYHVIHLYTTNMAGETVDIQKPVYIFPEPSDGNIVWNQGNSCVLFVASGIDADRDGTDDACDAEIGPARVAPMASTSESVVNGTAVTLGADAAPADEAQEVAVTDVDGALITNDERAVYILGVAEHDGSNADSGQSNNPAPTHQAFTEPVAQKLLRVNWLTVALITSVLTTVVAAGYYYWPK